jgi:hypothetical protein
MKDNSGEAWELIFSTAMPYQAEILKSLLEEENIISVIINKQDSSYLTFGEIELYVKQDDVLRAKQIIIRIPESE